MSNAAAIKSNVNVVIPSPARVPAIADLLTPGAGTTTVSVARLAREDYIRDLIEAALAGK